MKRAKKRSLVAVRARLALVRYSAGELPRAAVLRELACGYGPLLRRLHAAGLPRPIVPTKERRQMVNEFVRIVTETT